MNSREADFFTLVRSRSLRVPGLGLPGRRHPQPLCFAAPQLGLDAPRPRRDARLRFDPRLRRFSRRRDQAQQPGQRVAAVLFARAVRLREDDENAILGEPRPGKTQEAPFQRLVERGGTRHVETQMRGRFHLVDILSAGAARPRKGKCKILLLDDNVRRDFDPRHGLAPARRGFKFINRNALAPIKIFRASVADGASLSAICRRLAALMLALAGCSNYERPRRPAWRGEAEAACLARNLVHVSAYIQLAREIDGPGICGLTRPFKVSALLDGAVRFNSAYTLDCPMIAALNAWLTDIVQPAARRGSARRWSRSSHGRLQLPDHEQPAGRPHFRTRLRQCLRHRRIPPRRRARDFDRPRLDPGRRSNAGLPAGRPFRRLRQFTTVLGPGANIFHYNHIHVDLAMHGNTSDGPSPDLPTPTAGLARSRPPRDGLPNPPEIDEDMDIAQAGHPAGDVLALHMGPGPAPNARIPDAYFAAASTVPLPARAYAPVPPGTIQGALREDGGLFPKADPPIGICRLRPRRDRGTIRPYQKRRPAKKGSIPI